MGALAKKHAKMLDAIESACVEEDTGGEFEVISEWLGYLPFGLYVWVDVGSKTNVDQGFGLDGEPWDTSDFEALALQGYVAVIEHTVHSPDGMDTTTRYRLTAMALGRPR